MSGLRTKCHSEILVHYTDYLPPPFLRNCDLQNPEEGAYILWINKRSKGVVDAPSPPRSSVAAIAHQPATEGSGWRSARPSLLNQRPGWNDKTASPMSSVTSSCTRAFLCLQCSQHSGLAATSACVAPCHLSESSPPSTSLL